MKVFVRHRRVLTLRLAAHIGRINEVAVNSERKGAIEEAGLLSSGGLCVLVHLWWTIYRHFN